MKRLSSVQRIAWIRLSQQRERKHLTRLKKKALSRKQYSPTTVNPLNYIQAPKVFSLREKVLHKKLIQFIVKIKTSVLKNKQRIKIDFSQTEQMVVCGSLYFFAELENIKKELGSLNLISCTCPKNETVAQVLQHLGILTMLKCRCSVKPERDDVINWKVAFGEKTDATKVGKILESQSDLPTVKAKKLYRGVSEAMTNVSQHAYIEIENGIETPLDNKGWWMFYREENERIIVAFCDLGVGIPITLPYTMKKNHEESLFQQVLQHIFPNRKKYSDGELIHAAIEVKRSRTRHSHRGKGLLDMIKVLENIPDGELTILSNRGMYEYKRYNSQVSEKHKNYKESISGTLIIWSLPLINNLGNT
ncbi:MAG: hypothetical protein GQ582_09345 [Methyloprofundus sp.]|nr:hypothetical protein [Methyloprofundus sp.]